MPPSTAPEPSPKPLASLAIPLIGSLLQTGGVVWFLCRTPWHNSLSWPRLLTTALAFLAVTLVAHLFATWCNRRLFRQHVDAPVRRLLLAIWPSVVWLPLLVLLIRENSPFLVTIPPLIAVTAAISVKRWSAHPALSAAEASTISTLFHASEPPPILRALAPAILTSVGLEAAVTALVLGRPFTAALLLGLAVLFPAWAWLGSRSHPRAPEPPAPLTRLTVVVLVLLVIALLPYLKAGSWTGGLANLIQTAAAGPAPAAPRPSLRSSAQDSSYSGIVLIVPPQPRHEIAPPHPQTPVPSGSRPQQPVKILFDGEYWYFKQPDQRPRPDAPTVHGDPILKTIRSSNTLPLLMQAHQRLPASLSTGCCRAIRLAIRNADHRPGPIQLELLVRDTSSPEPASHSLGTLLLPSSETPPPFRTGPPSDEILDFVIPPNLRPAPFNELVVSITPDGDNARTGAHVAIQYFELLP